MKGECSRVERCVARHGNHDGDSAPETISCSVDGAASPGVLLLAKLVKADWHNRWGRPVEAAEILMIAGEVFEPLFHESPIGPVPDCLAPHWGVYGCVAEYEERYEELDRWKARELGRWLNDRVGCQWCVEGKVYELQVASEMEGCSERFCVHLIEDRTEWDTPAPGDDQQTEKPIGSFRCASRS